MGRKYILVEFCVKIFTYLILCEKLFRKSHVSENWLKIAQKSPKNAQNLKKKTEKAGKTRKKLKKAQNFKVAKKAQKARIFLGHSVQDCSKRTLLYMGIFFIEAIKKARALKSFP